MAHRYKIHLQIKPENLVWFMNDFMKFLKEDQDNKKKYRRLDNIYQFKFFHIFIPEKHKLPEKSSAIVVVYVKLLPGSTEEKISH